MPGSLQPCGLQHARLLWPLILCRVCSKLNPLSQWCYLTISSSATSFSFAFIFPRIRILSNESAGSSYQVAKVLNFYLQLSSSNEFSGLISLRIDCFDLLTVQGSLKNILQHHNSKASVLWCSALFLVQLSPLLMIAKNTIALTIQIFARTMISLLFNKLSRFVITFFPRSKCLLMSLL